MKHLEKYAPIIAAVAMLYAIGNGGWSLFDSFKSGERKLKEDLAITEYVEGAIQKAIDERMPNQTGYVFGPTSKPEVKKNGSNP